MGSSDHFTDSVLWISFSKMNESFFESIVHFGGGGKINSCIKIMYHDSLDDLKWSFIITLAFNYHGTSFIVLRRLWVLKTIHRQKSRWRCTAMLAIGYRKLRANLQMSRFINKISTVSASTLPISRHIWIQMPIYMYCLAEIWIVKTASLWWCLWC